MCAYIVCCDLIYEDESCWFCVKNNLIWRLELKKVGLEQVENTVGDSFELYYGLFMYNPNATEEVKSLHSSQGHW
jgi:hypothetical protein